MSSDLLETLRKILRDVDSDVLNLKKFLILTALYAVGSMTEGQLAKLLGLSWGSLYSCIKKLEELGLVRTRKVITDEGPRTLVELTDRGREVYLKVYRALRSLVEQTGSRPSKA